MESKELIDRCIQECEDRKAVDLLVYDVQGESILADYYLFCNGNSDVHVRAIASNLEKNLKDDLGLLPKSQEGKSESGWILIDYADVLIHIFTPETRDYYNFEDLHENMSVYYRGEENF